MLVMKVFRGASMSITTGVSMYISLESCFEQETDHGMTHDGGTYNILHCHVGRCRHGTYWMIYYDLSLFCRFRDKNEFGMLWHGPDALSMPLDV